MRLVFLLTVSLFFNISFALNNDEFDVLILSNIKDESCAEFLNQGNQTAIGTGAVVSVGGIDAMNRQEKLDLALCIISMNEVKGDFEENDGFPLKCEENSHQSRDGIHKTGAFVGYDLSYLKPEIIIHKNTSIGIKDVLNHEVLHCLNYFSYQELSLLDAINGDLRSKKSCLMEKQKFEQKLKSLLKNKIRLPNSLTDEIMEGKIGEFGFNKNKDFPVMKANRQIKNSLVKATVQNFLDTMQAYKQISPNVLCGEFIATVSQSFPMSVISYLSKSTARLIEKHINDARQGAYRNLSNEGKLAYSKIAFQE